MFLSNNVVNLMRCKGGVIRNESILAATLRLLVDQLTQCNRDIGHAALSFSIASAFARRTRCSRYSYRCHCSSSSSVSPSLRFFSSNSLICVCSVCEGRSFTISRVPEALPKLQHLGGSTVSRLIESI